MLEHLELFFKSIFIDNMVFAVFLGMCSYLAVSKKVATAVGLGAAVIFVLAVTVPLNWLLDQYLLQPGALSWLGEEYASYDKKLRSYEAYSSPDQLKAPGCNKYWSNNQFKGTVTAKTKITAAPKPTAVATFLDTAR